MIDDEGQIEYGKVRYPDLADFMREGKHDLERKLHRSLTIQDVAAIMEVPATTLGRIHRGENLPDIVNIKKIAAVYGPGIIKAVGLGSVVIYKELEEMNEGWSKLTKDERLNQLDHYREILDRKKNNQTAAAQ